MSESVSVNSANFINVRFGTTRGHVNQLEKWADLDDSDPSTKLNEAISVYAFIREQVDQGKQILLYDPLTGIESRARLRVIKDGIKYTV